MSMSYPSPGQRAGCVEHPRQFALLQETAALEADCIYLLTVIRFSIRGQTKC